MARQPEPLLIGLIALATWRVTALIAYESGPFRLFDRLRGFMVKVRLGRLAGCFHCLGIWVAAIAVLIVYGPEVFSILTWLAVAGAISIIERWLGGAIATESEEG